MDAAVVQRAPLDRPGRLSGHPPRTVAVGSAVCSSACALEAFQAWRAAVMLAWGIQQA